MCAVAIHYNRVLKSDSITHCTLLGEKMFRDNIFSTHLKCCL